MSVEKNQKESSAFAVTKDACRVYGEYVNNARHIPLVFDGLKNVYRRTIYATMLMSGKSPKFIKTARVVGEVIGKFHPHGDCKKFNSKVYGLDGKIYKIGELCENEVKSLEVLCLDKNNKVQRGIASDFRIGKYSKEYYKVTVNNKYVIEVTGNHPYQILKNIEINQKVANKYVISDNPWIKTEDLKVGDILSSSKVSVDKYWNFFTSFWGDIYTLGFEDYEYDIIHHWDEDHYNNTWDNLEPMSRGQHAAIHGVETIGATHLSMAEDPTNIERRKIRNSLMMRTVNENQSLLKCFKVIDYILSCGLEITEDNYALNRSSCGVYNATHLGKIYSKYLHQNPTIEGLKLLYYQFQEVGFLKLCSLMDGGESFVAEIHTGENKYPEELRRLTEVKSKARRNVAPRPDSDAYYRMLNPTNLDQVTIDWMEREIGFCQITSIEKVVLEEEEAFYDFTVKDYESMYEPLNEDLDNLLLVNTHNSSVSDVVTELVNIGIFDGQGNFGDKPIVGDASDAAAMRYTEVRMNSRWFAFFSILLKYVPYTDAECGGGVKEPLYLPTPFPLCMTFGLLGIGFGARAQTPSFSVASMYEAMKEDDPEALKPYYDVNMSSNSLDDLWWQGSGFVKYDFRVTMGMSASDEGIIIEGDTRCFNPDLSSIDSLIEQKKVFMRDESDASGPRVFIGKNPRMKIDMNALFVTCVNLCSSNEMYRLYVTDGNKVMPIPLKEWLDLTYSNYMRLLHVMIADKTKKFRKQEELYLALPKVADYVLNNRSFEAEKICSELVLPMDVVQLCLSKSLQSINAKNTDALLRGVRAKIAEITSFNPDKFIEDLSYGKA